MTSINTTRLAAIASLTAAFAAVSGCHSSSNDNGSPTPTTPVVDTVPNTVGNSSAAFVSYLQALPGEDETSQPNTIAATFTAPAEDTEEPTALR